MAELLLQVADDGGGTAAGARPVHPVIKLKNTLRHLMGEEIITHLGLDYYDSLRIEEQDYVRI